MLLGVCGMLLALGMIALAMVLGSGTMGLRSILVMFSSLIVLFFSHLFLHTSLLISKLVNYLCREIADTRADKENFSWNLKGVTFAPRSALTAWTFKRLAVAHTLGSGEFSHRLSKNWNAGELSCRTNRGMGCGVPLEFALPRRVLVVDDEPLVLDVTASMLEDLGCDVVIAANAREALEKLSTDQRIEILITDINMPGMDGYELAERATRIRERLKVIVVSGREQHSSGFPLVRKPFRAQDLETSDGSAHRALLTLAATSGSS